MVVRRAPDDLVFVLVPGDRVIDWPRLRRHLDRSRLSLADPAEVEAATGYRPGSITPLGSRKRWPVVADRRLATPEEVSIGSGVPGRSVRLRGEDLLSALDAQAADVTKPTESGA